MQQQDYMGILQAMEGLPVTIRLLDAPLHEFTDIHEENPMLGDRGTRFMLRRPEVGRMQVRAILRAAAHLQEQGIDARPEIMAPLVHLPAEVMAMRALVETVAAELQ